MARPCPGCGEEARLPAFDDNATCFQCQRAAPCVHCGRTGRPVGKLTVDGPVCNSCAPHFREKKSCGACGRSSSRLTTASEDGVARCPTCVSRLRQRTCQACRRSRVLHDAPDGRRLCRACLHDGSLPCPECARTMPAGRGARCEECASRLTLPRRLARHAAKFMTPGMAEQFMAFGEWLGREIGWHKARRTSGRHLSFFLEIEAYWAYIPDYAALLVHFGAGRLRRFELPMRWLRVAHGVTVDATLREQDSERRRIEALLGSLPSGTPASALLAAYHRRLQENVVSGRMTLRSVRLALRPAVNLMLGIDPTGLRVPIQTDLDRYLRLCPGQLAAVTGFVRVIRQELGTSFVLPTDVEYAHRHRQKTLEGRIIVLMRSPAVNHKAVLRWLRVTLPYFHGLSARVVRHLGAEQITFQGNQGIAVAWGGQVYWVPTTRCEDGCGQSMRSS